MMMAIAPAFIVWAAVLPLGDRWAITGAAL